MGKIVAQEANNEATEIGVQLCERCGNGCFDGPRRYQASFCARLGSRPLSYQVATFGVGQADQELTGGKRANRLSSLNSQNKADGFLPSVWQLSVSAVREQLHACREAAIVGR